MDTFEWSHLFETGLAEVDEQHRRLVALVNQLGKDIHSASLSHIDQTLDELVKYTVYHFECEEGFMDRHGLEPVYVERHRETHRRFVQQVANWLERRKKGEGIELQQLLEFLANWLIFHIMGDDQSLGRQVLAVSSGKTPKLAFEEDHASSDPRTDVLLVALRRLYVDLVERNEALLATQGTLSHLNATLEQRVSQRTAELQALNEQLQDEQAQLIEAEKMASLGRMVAGFAHEMNTPVGVAVGATSQLRELIAELRIMLSQQEVSEEQVLGCLDILDETSSLSLANLQRASGMVQSFKRTAVDQTSEAEREYDLAEVLEDVQKSLRNLFKRTAIEIRIDCAPGQRQFGQAGAVVQVLTNLMQNSLIHGFDEGKRAGIISVAARLRDGQVRIDYADNGVGMLADTLQRVFEPFYTTRRGKGGSGLGLYIAYNVVTEVLHGAIHCESTVGVGTRFTIEYPHRSSDPLQYKKADKP